MDTDHLAAFTGGADHTIGKVGNIRSLIAGGEGLVMRLHGTGTVWIQTRSFPALAEKMAPFLPSAK